MSYFHTTCSILTIIFLELFTPAIFCPAGLTAISESLYAEELYLKIRNELEPFKWDVAARDAHTRNTICENITNSNYFRWREYDLVDVDEDFHDLKRRRLWGTLTHVYDKPYVKASMEQPPPYVNPFKRVKFWKDGTVGRKYVRKIPFDEYVFICVVRNRRSQRVLSYYISKEYNVMVNDVIDLNWSPLYIAGRFIFPMVVGKEAQRILLAEEPAKSFINLDYGVEHYYIQKRRDVPGPVESSATDPLCKLILQPARENQHARLCSSALASTYFRGKVNCPHEKPKLTDCYYREITFQTEHARRLARGERYYEWMIYCGTWIPNSNYEVGYYISRAYSHNQVFVYSVLNEEIYLENLSSHVSIMDYI